MKSAALGGKAMLVLPLKIKIRAASIEKKKFIWIESSLINLSTSFYFRWSKSYVE